MLQGTVSIIMSSFTFCPPHWWLWIFKYQYCLVTCWNELYYLVVQYKFDYGLQKLENNKIGYVYDVIKKTLSCYFRGLASFGIH